jgi:predicted ester cyclase
MDISHNAKEILSEFIRRVWSEGDIEAADQYIAPRYTIHHDPGDPWDGKELDLEAYKNRVRLSRAPFPDQYFTLEGLFADGDAVVVTWLWTGTHKGDIPGFPASGRQIKMSGATVYYFDGTRLTGHWQVTDRLGVYQQLRQATPGS